VANVLTDSLALAAQNNSHTEPRIGKGAGFLPYDLFDELITHHTSSPWQKPSEPRDLSFVAPRTMLGRSPRGVRRHGATCFVMPPCDGPHRMRRHASHIWPHGARKGDSGLACQRGRTPFSQENSVRTHHAFFRVAPR